MNVINVRIDSIYGLALQRILEKDESVRVKLIDNTPQSVEQISPHDVHVGDFERREGISIKGVSAAVKKIETIIKTQMPDCIVFKHEMQKDAIYFATVTKYIYKKKIAILDLGNNKKGIMFNANTHVDDQVIVQIKELSAETDKLPVCSTLIALSGNYSILEVGSDFIRISRKIKGDDRRKLHEMGKELQPYGYGLILRTSAITATKQDIADEIEQQHSLWEETLKSKEELYRPQRLISGELQVDILLSYSSKRFLDHQRAEIKTTIPNYYEFKSYSVASNFALKLAQDFVDKIPPKELEASLQKLIYSNDYPINNHVRADFYYPDGSKEEISLGYLIKSGSIMKTRKILENDESYPNFEVKKSDIMEVIFSPGSWTVHYKYRSAITNEIIGERLRVITPLDLAFRGRIRAFDIGMNIYKNAATGDAVKNIRQSNVLNMVETGMISKALDSQFGEVLRISLESLDKGYEKILIKIEE